MKKEIVYEDFRLMPSNDRCDIPRQSESEMNLDEESMSEKTFVRGRLAARRLRAHSRAEFDQKLGDIAKLKVILQLPSLPLPYDALFERELGLVVEGSAVEASEEKEEYGKVIEERLYPLDEVELRRKIKAIEEEPRGLTLDKISMLLGIQVITLARTKESSPGEQSSPKY
ncbi:hypothetical protein PInf_002710 [Phytophthora infestans]|nr:hypothetical protein PInf_002710 [Phytophthora infestans]